MSTEEIARIIERIRCNFPSALQQLPIWLLWKSVPVPGEKPKKIPYYADGTPRRGQLDSPEDRQHLVEFENAALAWLKQPELAGLGIALGEVPGEDLHLSGMDFDHVLGNGELDPRVTKIIDMCSSYTELSPSGSGIHILGTGDVGVLKKDERGIEIYSRGRYFTVTGNIGESEGALPLACIADGATFAATTFGTAQPVKGNGADAHAQQAEVASGHFIEKGRNNWLSTECFRLVKQGASFEQIMAVLDAFNESRCRPPLPRTEIVTMVRSKLRIVPSDPAQQPNLQTPGERDVQATLAEIGTERPVSFADVSAGTYVDPVPLVEELLYPGAWLLVGRPKIGKSWLLLQLALAVAEAETFLGYNCSIAAAVLCFFAEDTNARIQKRLSTFGVNKPPANAFIYNREDALIFAKRYAEHCSFIEFLDAQLAAQPNVKLVLIDTETVMRQIWYGEAGKNARVTETDYAQTRVYDELALRRNIVIVLVNHAKKRNGDFFDIHELINRSNTALAGASGSISLADPPDADPFDTTAKLRIIGFRGRDLADDVLLAIHQDKGRPVFIVDGPYTEVREARVEDEALQALAELMPETEAGAYVPVDDIATAIGRSNATVKVTLWRRIRKGKTLWRSFRLTAKRGKRGGYRLDQIGDPAE